LLGAKGIEIAPGKFDYLFGRVASNSHNAARSNQLALEMKRLGVPDNAAGRQMLTDHLALSAKTEGNVINTFSNQYGKFEVKESLFVGPSGKAARNVSAVLKDKAPLHVGATTSRRQTSRVAAVRRLANRGKGTRQTRKSPAHSRHNTS
jgi:hypothetical protein